MKLLLGDCLDRLKELEDNSVDSIVTDPPYGLSFMNKQWDYDVPSIDIWKECLRVLKPGGYLLSFAGSRTYHRMAVRIEDAGFEIRDQIMWIYGSGFPKSMNVSKMIDKKFGAEREVIGEKPGHEEFVNRKTKGDTRFKDGMSGFDRPWMQDDEKRQMYHMETAPNTDEAKQWNGWGTALKPAHEPIVMARKPLDKNTVVDNVLEYGTGAINIDDSRIDVNINDDIFAKNPHTKGGFGHAAASIYGDSKGSDDYDPSKGRFPANVIFDEEAGKLLDEQSGTNKSGKVVENKKAYEGDSITGFQRGISNSNNQHGDEGGASRFFYCPKTSKTDRNEGLDDFEDKEAPKRDDGQPYGMNTNKFRPDGSERKPVQPKKNHHPTVKPTDLMLYLIRLVTPKNGTTLDPFMGSGSTGKASIRGGFDFIGIEREEEYFEIAEARINYEIENPFVENGERITKEQLDKSNKFFDFNL